MIGLAYLGEVSKASRTPDRAYSKKEQRQRREERRGVAIAATAGGLLGASTGNSYSEWKAPGLAESAASKKAGPRPQRPEYPDFEQFKEYKGTHVPPRTERVWNPNAGGRVTFEHLGDPKRQSRAQRIWDLHERAKYPGEKENAANRLRGMGIDPDNPPRTAAGGAWEEKTHPGGLRFDMFEDLRDSQQARQKASEVHDLNMQGYRAKWDKRNKVFDQTYKDFLRSHRRKSVLVGAGAEALALGGLGATAVALNRRKRRQAALR